MTVISSLPVREVVGAPVDDDGGWPFSMGAVAQVLRDGLALSELTVLVGENGVGKSTLIEAVAMAYGLSAEGGSTSWRPSERPTESRLHEHLRLIRGIGRSKWGYFRRAKTMHGLLTYLEQHPGGSDGVYHERSHGQAFTELLDTKLVFLVRRGGLLVLDNQQRFVGASTNIAEWLDKEAAHLIDHNVIDHVRRDGFQGAFAVAGFDRACADVIAIGFVILV